VDSLYFTSLMPNNELMRYAIPTPSSINGSHSFGRGIWPEETYRMLPFPMRFRLTSRGLRHWGAEGIAKATFLKGLSDIDLRVMFEVGRRPVGSQISPYGDPRSRWFNVFLGAYELRVPKTAGRPIGFSSTGEIVVNDLAAVALTDWGFLSNYMVGASVPLQARETGPPLTYEDTVVLLGKQKWHSVLATLTKVPTPRSSSAIQLNPYVFLWRHAFGGRLVSSGCPEYVDMTFRLFARCYETSSHFHTLVSGGSASHLLGHQDRDRFLGEQIAAVQQFVAERLSN
jgi:hypothetical protein